MSEETTKAYGYCRVSTNEQLLGTSIGLQKERIAAIANLHGYELVTIFEDGGVSGGMPLKERPAGGELLSTITPGDVVIVAKMDRLFRNLQDAVTVSQTWRDDGIGFILGDISSDPLDSGIGRLFFNIMGSIAEFERERILERTKEGRELRKKTGCYLGGRVPVGKKIEEKDGKKVVVLDESLKFDPVYEIHSLRGAGFTIKQIRNELIDTFGIDYSLMTISRYLKRNAPGENYVQ